MIQYYWIFFVNYFVVAWISIYNGVHEFKTIVCSYSNCIYGFRISNNFQAQFLNCTTTPLTAILLENSQMMVNEKDYSLAPTDQYLQQYIIFDIYFTSQWSDDIIKLEYNNELIQEIHYSTNNPLTFNYGLCDTIEYDVKTFIFSLPISSINLFPYPKFTITNSNVKAKIRNVHSTYQECYPTCSACSGPSKYECLSCNVGMEIANGECRCPIRQTFLNSQGQCGDKCSVIKSKGKPVNRLCVDFGLAFLLSTDLSWYSQSALLLWNIIYDPMHISTQSKKVSPYFLGLFKFREGAYISIDSVYEPYPLSLFIQIILCNKTPKNSGIQFQINQTQYGSINYDGENYQFDNVYLRSSSKYQTAGICTNNILMQLEMFTQYYQKKLMFTVSGNFTEDNAGWFIKDVEIGNGNCPYNCLTCDKQYFCTQCLYNYKRYSNGSCATNSCSKDSYWNGTFCIAYTDKTKYTTYLVKEFYDFTFRDTILNFFTLESQTTQDFQKGNNIMWSYEASSIVFGGKYVWSGARFSQIYNLRPHHSLSIYFQVIFGSKITNIHYLQYEINNSTIKKVLKTSNLSIAEDINAYHSQLAIALYCFGGNVIDQYCAISNYYIAVNYCRPYCLQCTNEFDCQQWDSFDPDVVKLFSSNCTSNQFLDEFTFTCESCPDECLTCFNEYECLSCQTNYHLYKTTCLLDCLFNQFYDGISCQNCQYSCKQCKSSSFNDCIHCEVTDLRYLQDGQCICYDGYYDQLNTPLCQSCNILCTTCIGPTNKDCKQCISLTNVVQNGQNCQCNNGYYFDYNLIQCQQCDNQCLTCFGNTNFNCLSCNSNQFRTLQGFQCQCYQGYYELNQQDQCQLCPNAIDNSLLQCFKDCGDGVTKWFNRSCTPITCMTGFQNIDDLCIPICGDGVKLGEEECDDKNEIQFDGCYNCRFQCPIQCTTCDSLTTFPCPDVCGDGYTTGDEECDDGNNLQYDGCYQCKLECQIQCTKCLKGLCSECQTFGWILDPSTRLCIENCGDKNIVGKEECDDGYNFDANDGCLNCKFLCRNDCLTCSADGKTCQTCLTIGFKPQSYYCINICGDGYLAVDPFNRYVEQCDDFNLVSNDGCSSTCQFQCQPTSLCTVCVNNKCQSCIPTYYLDTAKNKCIELCNDNIIVGNEKCDDVNNQMNDGCYNCQLSCQPNCQTCTITGCQTCKIGYQLIDTVCKNICGDKIVVSEEDCDDGNMIAFDGCHQCKYFCDSSCKVCYQGKCLECENGFQKVNYKCYYRQSVQAESKIQTLEKIYRIIDCQVQFQLTCLKCEDQFELNIFNNKCDYRKKEEDFQIKINMSQDQRFNVFISKELNCKYYLNDFGCLECTKNFFYDSFNNKCNYKYENPIFQIKIDNIYSKIKFIDIFKSKELNCKFFINNPQQECLECFNNFSFNKITKDCNSNCGDQILNGLEQCEDSNQLQFDGCYDCQYQCCEYCQICKYGKCTKCMDNYFLVVSETKCVIKLTCNEVGFYYDEHKNECYDICGDGIISKNEQCDDANNIPYDGCYKCQYQCPKLCGVCEKGQCIIKQPKYCERGYYYFFDADECLPICGDGIQVLPFEECDDGNNQKDDECDNCLLKCNSFCKVCKFQNQCSVCKDNYELVNQTCLESQNIQCYIENCQVCKNDLCLYCNQGFFLYNDICQSICGDGIVVDSELCDDGNMINSDGCDEDCQPSKNSLCKAQECAFVTPPQAKLIYLYEVQGEQFLLLQYSQKMMIAEQYTVEDFIQSLSFSIQDVLENVTSFTILDQNKIVKSLSDLDFTITIKINFQSNLAEPIFILNITDTNVLVNEFGISIEENLFSLGLKQPNILTQQELQSTQSLISLSEQNLKIFAFCITFASITGKFEIIENILETIQQLYYLKYINSRIGVNLEQYFQTFKIIQLVNILGYLNLNPSTSLDSSFQYINSEAIFQFDGRNANFIPSFLQYISVISIFTSMFFCLKLVSKGLILLTKKIEEKYQYQNKALLYLIIFSINVCIKIQEQDYFIQSKYLFSALTQEYRITTILALKYSGHKGQGILGFWVALIFFYAVLLKLIMMISRTANHKQNTCQKKEKNVYVYICIQRLYFTSTLVLFYNSAIIQIFCNIINEIVMCIIILRFRIFQQKTENIKKLWHHFIQIVILILYIFNESNQDNVSAMIKIAWVIISFMTFILLQTALIDLVSLTLPILQKIISNFSSKQKTTTNEIICILTFPKDGINKSYQKE